MNRAPKVKPVLAKVIRRGQMSLMALLNAASGAATRIKPGRRDSLRQAIALQELVFGAALKFKGQNPGAEKQPDAREAVALANLVRAWDTLEDRKRILRGRPLPGSLKPTAKKPKRGNGYPFFGPVGPAEARAPDEAITAASVS